MILDELQKTELSFKGEGGEMFGLYFVNMLLTVITLGLYYPWAKAKISRYMHGKTELEGQPFVFHGTGKEMFLGLIKAIGAMALLLGLIMLLQQMLGIFYGSMLGGLLLFVVIVLGTPYSIHGSMRYQTSRTSWNGIHWGYRGQLTVFMGKFIGGWFLTIITLGIYGAWYFEGLRKYMISNTRFGNIQFKYKGDGMAYFLLNLKGILLTICTVGIYFFWYSKEVFNHTLKNTSAMQENGEEITFTSTLTGGALFMHTLTNMLLVVFTLGIGFPWAIARSLRFVYENIIIEGKFEAEKLIDTEVEYNDALAEGVGEVLEATF